MAITVTITRGLPGCGKSTWCKEQVQEDPKNNVVINADALRKMFHDSYWFRDRSYRDVTENFVRKACMNLAQLSIDEHKNVIIDETNLSERSFNKWQQFAIQNKAEFVIQDFRDVPLNICLDRDTGREKRVGEKVIKDKYNQFILPLHSSFEPQIISDSVTTTTREALAFDVRLPDAVIFDMDNSLANNNGRSPYDLSKCEEDPVVWPIMNLLEKFDEMGYSILIVSGRDEGLAREKTESWLEKNTMVKPAGVFMRAEGDTRRDDIIKEELYETYIKNKYNVAWVVDDRNRVVDMWRSIGLTCLQCAEGNF